MSLRLALFISVVVCQVAINEAPNRFDGLFVEAVNLAQVILYSFFTGKSGETAKRPWWRRDSEVFGYDRDFPHLYLTRSLEQLRYLRVLNA